MIWHVSRAILDENEKARDSAIAVSLAFCILCSANRIHSFLRACYKDCCDTKSDSKEKVGEFKVAVCSVYFEYAFINRAYRKCCDSALPWETGICRERFLKTMQKEAWHSESQERN